MYKFQKPLNLKETFKLLDVTEKKNTQFVFQQRDSLQIITPGMFDAEYWTHLLTSSRITAIDTVPKSDIYADPNRTGEITVIYGDFL